jgi:hypothetical protein
VLAVVADRRGDRIDAGDPLRLLAHGLRCCGKAPILGQPAERTRSLPRLHGPICRSCVSCYSRMRCAGLRLKPLLQ